MQNTAHKDKGSVIEDHNVLGLIDNDTGRVLYIYNQDRSMPNSEVLEVIKADLSKSEADNTEFVVDYDFDTFPSESASDAEARENPFGSKDILAFDFKNIKASELLKSSIKAFESIKVNGGKPISLEQIKDADIDEALLTLSKYIGSRTTRLEVAKYVHKKDKELAKIDELKKKSDASPSSKTLLKKYKDAKKKHEDTEKALKTKLTSYFSDFLTHSNFKLEKTKIPAVFPHLTPGAVQKAQKEPYTDNVGRKNAFVELEWHSSGLALAPFTSLFRRTDILRGTKKEALEDGSCNETTVPAFYDTLQEEIQYTTNELLYGVVHPDTQNLIPSVVDKFFEKYKNKNQNLKLALVSKIEEILRACRDDINACDLTKKDVKDRLDALEKTVSQVLSAVKPEKSKTKTSKTKRKDSVESVAEDTVVSLEDSEQSEAILVDVDTSTILSDIDDELVASDKGVKVINEFMESVYDLIFLWHSRHSIEKILKSGKGRAVEYRFDPKEKGPISDEENEKAQKRTRNELPIIATDFNPKKIESSPTVCPSATESCRHSCLVVSGQNVVGGRSILGREYATVPKDEKADKIRRDLKPYQTNNPALKMYATIMFYAEPVAFCRVLVEILRTYASEMEQNKITLINKGLLNPSVLKDKNVLPPFYRLNVYSDIPWEIYFPDLFSIFDGTKPINYLWNDKKKIEHYGSLNAANKTFLKPSNELLIPRIWFYDYTKISNRGPYLHRFDASAPGGFESKLKFVLENGNEISLTDIIEIEANGKTFDRNLLKKLDNYYLTFSYGGSNGLACVKELILNKRNVTLAFYKMGETSVKEIVAQYLGQKVEATFSKGGQVTQIGADGKTKTVKTLGITVPESERFTTEEINEMRDFFNSLLDLTMFPETFWGFKVIDGDLYDNRVYDRYIQKELYGERNKEEPVIIGLSWKSVKISIDYDMSTPLNDALAGKFAGVNLARIVAGDASQKYNLSVVNLDILGDKKSGQEKLKLQPFYVEDGAVKFLDTRIGGLVSKIQELAQKALAESQKTKREASGVDKEKDLAKERRSLTLQQRQASAAFSMFEFVKQIKGEQLSKQAKDAMIEKIKDIFYAENMFSLVHTVTENGTPENKT